MKILSILSTEAATTGRLYVNSISSFQFLRTFGRYISVVDPVPARLTICATLQTIRPTLAPIGE